MKPRVNQKERSHKRKNMSRYEMRDRELYDAHNRRIAVVRGGGIYDGSNRRVATIRGNDLFDSDDRKMVTIHGSDIYDADNKKVASLSDALESIKGAEEGVLLVALWYCFVR
jgi:hypothetical protein